MITVIPAYGKDYTSAKAVKADWEAGKDFIIADYHNPYDGKPININNSSGEDINVRYSKLRKCLVIKKK